MSDHGLEVTESKESDDVEAVKDVWLRILRLSVHHFEAQYSFIAKAALNANRRRTLNGIMSRRLLMNELVYKNDEICLEQLRMDRSTFYSLCILLQKDANLNDTHDMLVDEQVAMFLHILAHLVKNRVIKFRFRRYEEIINSHFRRVLYAVNRLHKNLLKSPVPIPEDCSDENWKHFKNCVGGIGGTHIKVRVSSIDKPRYRTRNGDITQNVLAACSPDEQFIYILAGWEGSAADNRVFKDALSREDGLKVPTGKYYLVNPGLPNMEGFLKPFSAQQWKDGQQPHTAEEYYDYKHSSARNVVERCFGQMKDRWAILRSPSNFSIEIETKIILACCLLHNFIKKTMSEEPICAATTATANTPSVAANYDSSVSQSGGDWNSYRQELVARMFREWKTSRMTSS